MMAPQPQDPYCLRQREAEARQFQAQQDANAKVRQNRMLVEQSKCESASADDVKSTMEQTPILLGQYLKILDVTAPHFADDTCRAEAMTNKGIVDVIITFQDFNGKNYIQVRIVPHIGN
jgi:hypothetical protein